MQKQEYWIGVDLHSRVIQVCVLDSVGHIVLEERYLGASLAEGIASVERLARRFPGARLAVEAVGCNRWFVRACREAGFVVSVAHAAELQLKSSGRKTDRRDAQEIARRHRLGDIDRRARSYHPSDEEYALRQLTRRRHGIVQQRTATITRIRGMLRAHRVAAPRGYLYGAKAVAALKQIELPDAIETEVLQTQVDLLVALHASVARLDKQLAVTARSHPVCATLLGLPFVGPVTATTLAGELGDVRRFKGPKAVASHAGLVPSVRQSAGQAYHGRIVRHGNRELRFVLGEWAVQMMRCHPLVQRWVEVRKERTPTNKLRVALARRLLVGAWHTLVTGETFCIERCLGLSEQR